MDKKISDIKELKRKFATSDINNVDYLLLYKTLKRNELTLDDIKVIDMNNKEVIAFFMKGNVAAFTSVITPELDKMIDCNQVEVISS